MTLLWNQINYFVNAFLDLIYFCGGLKAFLKHFLWAFIELTFWSTYL